MKTPRGLKEVAVPESPINTSILSTFKMEAYHKKQEHQLLTHLKPLDLYMEMREEGGGCLENISLLTPGIQPRFKCGDAEGLGRSELVALYRKYRPLKQYRVYVDYVGGIWDFLFVKRGYLADRSLGWIMRSCSPEEIAMAGQEPEEVADKLHDSPAHHTRSKTNRKESDGVSWAFENNENTVVLPPVEDVSALRTLAAVAAKVAEAEKAEKAVEADEDYSDMPPLISAEYANTLEILEAKELALKKEAEELDCVWARIQEVRALKATVDARRDALIAAIREME